MELAHQVGAGASGSEATVKDLAWNASNLDPTNTYRPISMVVRTRGYRNHHARIAISGVEPGDGQRRPTSTNRYDVDLDDLTDLHLNRRIGVAIEAARDACGVRWTEAEQIRRRIGLTGHDQAGKQQDEQQSTTDHPSHEYEYRR